MQNPLLDNGLHGDDTGLEITLARSAKMEKQNASFAKQWHMLDIARRECYARMSIEPPKFSSGLWCNRTWDNVMCWDDSPASTVVKQRCPSYINGFNNNNFAYKKCTSSGTWYQKTETNTTWTNYSSCINRFPKESFGGSHEPDSSDHQRRLWRLIHHPQRGHYGSHTLQVSNFFFFLFIRHPLYLFLFMSG